MTGRGRAGRKPVKRKYVFSENLRRKLYLLGRPLDNLPQLQLPTNGDVLRYYLNLKTPKHLKFKADSFIAGCSQKSSNSELVCAGPGGKCENKERRCCAGAVIDLWEKAGFGGRLRISGKAVKNKVINLYKKYKGLANLGTAHLVKDKTYKEEFSAMEEEYIQESGQLFDISARDFEKQLESDRMRTATARKYDMMFYNDQREKRIGIMDENCPDLEFAEAHRKKMAREYNEKQAKESLEKEKELSAGNKVNEPELELSFDAGSDFEDAGSEDSSDHVVERRHRKQLERPKVKITINIFFFHWRLKFY